jgi:ATP-dependent exoDNAse (exonuclease V) alpha subunit
MTATPPAAGRPTLQPQPQPGTHPLFVGDVDQLPSVGAGEVLRDLLGANRLLRVRLTNIFRQAQQSGVVTNAHRINAGQHPITHGLADFFLFVEEDSDRVGDKVMQIRNNYDKGTAGVFNGSVGQVTALSLEDQELRVLLDEDEEVGYGFDELDELTHAYAVSIHRSQGSEYSCVVVPETTSAWLMLQRNLLYTAVTRAKRMVVPTDHLGDLRALLLFIFLGAPYVERLRGNHTLSAA